MRVALVFPPQWDPRQPPLTLPALEAALRGTGAQTRSWDLNLTLYRSLLAGIDPHSVSGHLLKRFADPLLLSDPGRFQRVSSLVQELVTESYDPGGNHILHWDSLRSPLSPNRSRDWKRAILEPGLLPFEAVVEPSLVEIQSWEPDVIGISAISDSQLLPALAVVRNIRSRIPRSRIFLGGDAFSYRRSLLPQHQWLFSHVDGICVADGEPTLRGIVEGRQPGEIPNLAWSDGKQVHSPQRCTLHGFGASSSPVFDPVATRDYFSPRLVIPVETARGCPWSRCAFCIHPFGSRESPGHNPKPLGEVRAELESHLASGFERFFFVDEAIPPARLADLSRMIPGLSRPVSWIAYSRLDQGHSAEELQNARKAGCRKLFFGLESASERILKRFGKGITVAGARKVLMDAGEAGIGIHLFLMTGFPGESIEDQDATTEFLRTILPRLDPFSFSFDLFPLWAERETPLFADPKRFGANGILRSADDDLAYQYRLEASPGTGRPPLRFLEAVTDTVVGAFGGRDGLHTIRFSQDSLHLLMIESNE